MRLTIRRRTLVSFQESQDYLLPHQGKMKSFLLILFIPTFFESGVGTDGARTRSFRLDRAVLWPIELQSQENEVYSLHFFLFIRTIYFRRVVTETRMIYYIIFE